MIRYRICSVAVVVGALLVWAMPATAKRTAASAATAKTATVTVTAGKPSEFHFTLSKKTVPAGLVTFKVTNKGQLPHDFKIAGHKTKLLSPGKSQTLKVRLKKAGKYPFLCTVTGHAAAGMKGVLKATGAKKAAAKKTTAGVKAARAASTTDAVTAGKPSEFRFALSKKTVRVGVVTFKVTNKGQLPHDFKIAGHKTKLITPGSTQTLKVTFKKAGKYPYLCTVTGHAAAGMKGTLVVKK